MTWIQISCILIIFSIDHQIHATDIEGSGGGPDGCYNQKIENERGQKLCFNQHVNHAELLRDVQTTVLQYAGDVEAIRDLSDKYCPHIVQAYQCLTIVVDAPNTCVSPNELAENLQTNKFINGLLSYVCANRSEVILEFLEHNGLATIVGNEKFKDCGRLVGRQLCDGFNDAVSCYADTVREHPNKYLIEITNNVQAIYHESVDCQGAENELV